MATALQDDETLEDASIRTQVYDILEQIASSGITVKSQQRGEPDLTTDQKILILREILNKNPGTFLTRFGQVLTADNLEYFETFKGDYEVEYRLKQLKKLTSKQARDRDIKNRRYACLQHLIQNGEYFSDEEMKHRNPLLYEQYVGQYMNQEEKDERDISQLNSINKLSLRLLHQWDLQQDDQLLRRQKDFEDGMEEEEESSEEESETSSENESEENKHEEKSETVEKTTKVSEKTETMDTDWVPNEDEREMLHHELTMIMQQRFLNGQDRDFDYTQVDNCEDYDNLTLRTQDEEEAYFDKEEPEDVADLVENGT